MGVMGRVFEFLGFETTEKEPKRKSKKDKKVKATYNFKKKQKVEKIDNIDGVKVVYPEILDDSEDYLEYIRKDEPLIISIEYCQREEIDKIVAYLTGAVAMTGGKIAILEKDKYYILLPEDMEIEE